jgi:hypothetical protein
MALCVRPGLNPFAQDPLRDRDSQGARTIEINSRKLSESATRTRSSDANGQGYRRGKSVPVLLRASHHSSKDPLRIPWPSRRRRHPAALGVSKKKEAYVRINIYVLTLASLAFVGCATEPTTVRTTTTVIRPRPTAMPVEVWMRSKNDGWQSISGHPGWWP